MEKHPIGDLMETTMNKIREMVDVNTIVGSPITTADGITLIPISKVSFGFASGGSDFQTKGQQSSGNNSFGGGSGAGVTIVPVAFITVKDGTVKLLSVNPPAGNAVDRIVEMVPEVIDKVKDILSTKKDEN
ncbi:MAG: sporulation protein YtfJ [Clostridiales bacterium]|nr:sporulation protein YtfJ [Clostridiales bacterium]